MRRGFPTLEQSIRVACLFEATAKKPGNVHPAAAFDDLTYEDFVKSANVIAPILANARQAGVGQTILEAVQATQKLGIGNSNLGIILLLTPLAAVPEHTPLEVGVQNVLDELTRDDADWVYRAIRLAHPGGMGKVEAGDVSNQPAGTLLEMMKLASGRDRIASEYASGYSITFEFGVAFLRGVMDFENRWEAAIIELHLRLMAEFPDTLIARKCGWKTAEESARRARDVLEAGSFQDEAFRQKLKDFDRWLRADGHKRNPGTTADLIAAGLFAAFREGSIRIPSTFATSE